MGSASLKARGLQDTWAQSMVHGPDMEPTESCCSLLRPVCIPHSMALPHHQSLNQESRRTGRPRHDQATWMIARDVEKSREPGPRLQLPAGRPASPDGATRLYLHARTTTQFHSLGLKRPEDASGPAICSRLPLWFDVVVAISYRASQLADVKESLNYSSGGLGVLPR